MPSLSQFFAFAATVCVGALIALAAPPAPPASPASPVATAPAGTQKVRVLILDGFSNHNWRLNTKLLRGLLEPSGYFDVTVSTCPPNPNAAGWADWRPDFAKTDVVLQTCSDINQRGPAWPDPVKTAFVDFVKKGGGAFIYHSGNNAFANWPEYSQIIGIGWRNANFGTALRIEDEKIIRIPAGQGGGTNHAARSEVLVQRLGDHPIHEGFPRSWKSPMLEVYTNARGPAENLDVISYGQDPQAKLFWPLEWTVKYGEGRVYSSTFGHVWSDESEEKQPVNLLAADAQTILMRTLQWLAKRPVTVPVPKDFPTAERASVRPNIPLPK